MSGAFGQRFPPRCGGFPFRPGRRVGVVAWARPALTGSIFWANRPSELMGRIRFDGNHPAVTAVGGALPCLNIRLNAEIENDFDGPPPGGGNQPSYVLVGSQTLFDLQGVAILGLRTSYPPLGMSIGRSFNCELQVNAYLDRLTLQGIEKNRNHDVTGSLTFHLGFLRNGSPHFQWNQGSVNLRLSAAEWTKLLDQMGYRTSWILEMDRPDIEGWDTVKGHLEKAGACVAAMDADGTMNHCRAAWKASDPLLKAMGTAIAALIDVGSKGEPNQPAKSARFEAIQGAIEKMAHTGPHSEFYATTMDDALLVYRLTVSTFAYLARKAASVPK